MACRESMNGVVSPRHCPKCGYGFSRVQDSQDAEGYVRRRRKCRSLKCDYVWVTYEIHRPSAAELSPIKHRPKVSNRGRKTVEPALAKIRGDRSEFKIPNNHYENEDHPHDQTD
jgi:hypothetical protein